MYYIIYTMVCRYMAYLRGTRICIMVIICICCIMLYNVE